MAPFSIPAPSIVPARKPAFGGPKSLDTNTKVELQCETQLEHEIFYTLDGTKPQPYGGIVQGSKTFKYSSPLCLPPGKITIRAIAIHAKIHSMYSNVITKTFEVIKVKPITKSNGGMKKKLKMRKAKTNFLSSPKISESNPNDEVSDPDFDKVENSSDRKQSDIQTLCLNAEQSDEEYFMKDNDLNSSGSNSIGENLEDKTIYDFEETILLEEEASPSKSFRLKLGKKETKPDYLTNNGVDYVDDLIELKNDTSKETLNGSILYGKDYLQCHLCHATSIYTAKYCTQCGGKLQQLCYHCEEFCLINAVFCQNCGSKLEDSKKEVKYEVDFVEKRKKIDVFTQNSSVCVNKSAQTTPIKVSKNHPITPDKVLSNHSTTSAKVSNNHPPTPSPTSKLKLPPHSPGRGYWHQQLDFICNHLKSYAYNNIEFRESISKPVLSTFQSAEVTRNDENVTVTLIFSPLIVEKKIVDSPSH